MCTWEEVLVVEDSLERPVPQFGNVTEFTTPVEEIGRVLATESE